MQKASFVIGLLVIAVGGCGTAATAPAGRPVPATPPSGQAIPGEYIVHARPGSSPALRAGKLLSTLDLGSQGRFLLVRADLSASALQRQLESTDVLAVTPNRSFKLELPRAGATLPVPSLPESRDPLYEQQWYLPRVGADRAWQATRGKGVVAAVVDTGIDYNHPDLAGNVVGPGHSFVTGKPDAIDVFGHGTHVAGIIAAMADNGEGVAGVAPETRLLPIGVLGANGGGSLFAIAAGIKHAADYGEAQKVHVVINLSLGGPGTAFDPISTAAGAYATGKGALPVAAAGNSNEGVGTPAKIQEYYMAVSAIDRDDKKASFSNYGPEIAVGAPGVDIMNTTPTYQCPLNEHGYARNYAALKGTSMATPVVAGVCALVWSRNPDWTWRQVRDHVARTALDLGKPGKDDVYGSGLVQAAAAVGAAR
ncbi:MAG: S8 family serine peptidase [Candidatus Sericytochromatia bacterium]|nr:S8 family serine peptidase [Candidatus Tanganyikabacteria bacterium]